MLKSGAGIVGLVFTVLGLAFTPVGAYFTHKWLTTDEPDRAYACRSSSGGSATCYEGETANMIVGITFSGLGLCGLLIGPPFLLRAARRVALRERLLAEGRRVEGVVTNVTRTNVEINDRRVCAYEIEFPGPAGPVRFVHKATSGPRTGSRVVVAHDHGDPSQAVFVEAAPTGEGREVFGTRSGPVSL